MTWLLLLGFLKSKQHASVAQGQEESNISLRRVEMKTRSR